MKILPRFVPFLGMLSGGFLSAWISGFGTRSMIASVWLFVGVGLYYVADMISSRQILLNQRLTKRARLQEARLCALDAHLGYKEVERIYANSIEKTEEEEES